MTHRLATASTVIAARALAASRERETAATGLRLNAPSSDAVMSLHEVRQVLRHSGYRDIDFVDRDGAMYELTASKHGDEHLVVVNAYSGEILHR